MGFTYTLETITPSAGRTQPDNPIWAIIGVPCRDEWEMEAGQILIDKARHLDALLLAEWMMDRERFSYWFKWVLPFSPLFSRSQEE